MTDQTNSATKRGRKRKSVDTMSAFDPPIVSLPPDEDSDDVDSPVKINDTGTVEITGDDGFVTIDPTGESLLADNDDDEADTDFSANLANKVDVLHRGRIAEELLTAIEAHKQDRNQWVQIRAKLVELLGLKIEEPKSDVSTSALGMSTSVVRDPVLAQAVETFRANAYAEMCPASGPVKVVNFGPETEDADQLARNLENDLNYYLTQTATEYYPDTRYMLWWTGLASGTFKKVYSCPRRRRPVSEYVDGTNLIVPSNATDLANAGQIAHQVTMRPNEVKRMQYLGVYRKTDLQMPMAVQPNAVEAKVATTDGTTAQPQRIEDQNFTLYEVYCELDLPGFEHTDEDGTPTGLALPYRVTIEETSREILEIRRNWDEDDPDQIAKIPFVLFPYSTGLSRIYGSGLGQLLGNMAMALTALMRITIDSGMMSTFPGLLKAKGTGRQLSNEIRVPPGGAAEIDTGGLPIRDAVMGMPYKDMSAQVIAFIAQLREVAARLGSAAELPVGEGKADVPVGTMLAMIEQATKVEGAVHKALHAAQAEEFRKLVDLFRADPESLWRGNRRPALGGDPQTRLDRFKQALDNCDIVPMSDPNVPSETHRLLKALAFKQTVAANPQIDQLAVDRYVAETMKVDDFDQFVLKQGPQLPPPPTPEQQALLANVQINKQNADTKQLQVMLQAQNQEKDRQSDENIAALKMAHDHVNAATPEQPDPLQAKALELKQQQLNQNAVKLGVDAQNAHEDRAAEQTTKAMDIAARVATHPDAQPAVNQELMGLAPFLSPVPTQAKGPLMAQGGKVEPDIPSIEQVLAEIERFVKQTGRAPTFQ